MEKFLKWESPTGVFITYARYSKKIHFVFELGLDDLGDVITCAKIDKRHSEKEEFYVNDNPGNITKQEFDAAVEKFIRFIKK